MVRTTVILNRYVRHANTLLVRLPVGCLHTPSSTTGLDSSGSSCPSTVPLPVRHCGSGFLYSGCHYGPVTVALTAARTVRCSFTCRLPLAYLLLRSRSGELAAAVFRLYRFC